MSLDRYAPHSQLLSKSTGIPTMPCTDQGRLVDIALEESPVEVNPADSSERLQNDP